MQKQIKHIVLLIFSIAYSAGMIYTLYRDVNFFLTKRIANATIIRTNDINKSNEISLQINYYNDYLKGNLKSTISLKQYDFTQFIENENSQISIFYAKNYPYKIYIENINNPRWGILIFEVIMLLLMSFLFYSSLKNLTQNIKII